MEFLKATQTRCETGQIASFGLKPAQNEEDFQQGSAQNEEDFQQGFVGEKGFTQGYRFSDGPFNLRFDCDDSWRSVFLFLEGPVITLN